MSPYFPKIGGFVILAFVILITLVIIFFNKMLFTDLILLDRLFTTHFYPTRYFVAECIKNGCIPFWNPYVYCGTPLFAELQSAVFYPPSGLTYFLPFNMGIKLFIVFHVCLASISMYLLLKHWGLSIIPSLIGAIVFSFNGYLLSVVEMLNLLAAASWIPLIFLLMDIVISKKKGVVWLGLVIGLQFLAGEPSTLYMTILVLIGFVLTKKSPFCNIKFLLISGIIGIGIVLFQVIPFLEMVTLSTRSGGIGYSEATKFSLAPYELIGLILPIFSENLTQRPFFFFSQDFLKSIYIGILPIYCICIACVYKPRTYCIFWLWIFIIFILLSLGKYFPFYPILYKWLPGFSLMRFPTKFFCMVTFAGAILSGFGADKILKKLNVQGMKEIKANNSKYILLPPTIFVLILTMIWLIGMINQTEILDFIKNTYYPHISFVETLRLTKEYSIILHNISICLLLVSIALLILIGINKFKWKILSFCFFCIIVVDLFIFNLKLIPLVKEEFYQHQSEIHNILKNDKEFYRVTLSPELENARYSFVNYPTIFEGLKDIQGFIAPNMGIIHHIFDISGSSYHSLNIKRQKRFLSAAMSGEFSEAIKLLSLANVKYIISKNIIPSEDVRLIYSNNHVKVYENLKCLPRVFFVPEAIIVKDDILKCLKNLEFNPTEKIILEKLPKNSGSISIPSLCRQETTPNPTFLNEKSIDTCKIVEYQPNKIVIDINTSKQGFIFIGETYYPGWKAYVDKHNVELYRANYTFRAIEIPAGKHRVILIYSPFKFKIGVLGSMLTIFLIGVVPLLVRRRIRVS